MESTETIYFWRCLLINGFSGAITSTRITMRFSITGLESAVGELTMFVFICKTDKSKPVKQEVNGTVIVPPLVFPALP
jgi:hypothetical protein